jgi:hypothetical protein
MHKYPKIETVYQRDMDGTKKLLDGVFRSDVVCLLSACPLWVAYEKLDGSNHQIFWDGHTITLGGRTENSNIPKPVVEYFENKFNNNETEELFEQIFGDKPMVLYFEAIGNKIQTYGKHYGDEPRFVLLDVYNVNNDSWWNYGTEDDTLPDCRSICAMANALGVEFKRIAKIGTIDDIIAYVKSKPMSMFAKEGDELPMEGVVAVPCLELKDGNGERIIVKIKGCDHCEDWANFMKAYK